MQDTILNIPVKNNKPLYYLRVLEKNRSFYNHRSTINLELYNEPDREFILAAILSLAIAFIILHKRGTIHSHSHSNNADTILKKISSSNSPMEITDVIEKNYDVDINIRKKKNISESLRKKYSHLPISWGNGKTSIKDFAGIWEGRDISLADIRKTAWERK